jgi:hypothetical protein
MFPDTSWYGHSFMCQSLSARLSYSLYMSWRTEGIPDSSRQKKIHGCKYDVMYMQKSFTLFNEPPHIYRYIYLLVHITMTYCLVFWIYVITEYTIVIDSGYCNFYSLQFISLLNAEHLFFIFILFIPFPHYTAFTHHTRNMRPIYHIILCNIGKTLWHESLCKHLSMYRFCWEQIIIVLNV